MAVYYLRYYRKYVTYEEMGFPSTHCSTPHQAVILLFHIQHEHAPPHDCQIQTREAPGAPVSRPS
jgi:hypothetical protein